MRFPQKVNTELIWNIPYPRFENYRVFDFSNCKDIRFDIYDPNDNPNNIVQLYRFLLNPRRWVPASQFRRSILKRHYIYLNKEIQLGRIERRPIFEKRSSHEYRVTDLGYRTFLTGILPYRLTPVLS